MAAPASQPAPAHDELPAARHVPTQLSTRQVRPRELNELIRKAGIISRLDNGDVVRPEDLEVASPQHGSDRAELPLRPRTVTTSRSVPVG